MHSPTNEASGCAPWRRWWGAVGVGGGCCQGRRDTREGGSHPARPPKQSAAAAWLPLLPVCVSAACPISGFPKPSNLQPVTLLHCQRTAGADQRCAGGKNPAPSARFTPGTSWVGQGSVYATVRLAVGLCSLSISCWLQPPRAAYCITQLPTGLGCQDSATSHKLKCVCVQCCHP